MRIFLLFFPVFFFCGLLHAQTVKVEYGGDPLPDKNRKKIEQFLQHEVDFYSQFGLPDTLSLQLYVFENRREAIDYLESINVSLPIKASGAYSPKLQKAVILGRENGRERSLAIIYHELSHHSFRRFSASVLQAGLTKDCRSTSNIAPFTKKQSATHLPNTNKGEFGRCICWEK